VTYVGYGFTEEAKLSGEFFERKEEAKELVASTRSTHKYIKKTASFGPSCKVTEPWDESSSLLTLLWSDARSSPRPR
jgi:hypothetical protein